MYCVNNFLKAAGFAACFFLFSALQTAPRSQHPMLVIAEDSNFGSFAAEILQTEGFAEYEMDSLTDPKISLLYLQQFDLILLTENAMTNAQRDLFADYVRNGGNLIAFKPDKKMKDIFGIEDAGDALEDAYLSIDAGTETGRGISAQTLQIHGSADAYVLNGAEKIAGLFKDAVSATAYPAVVENDFGKGHAMAFLYNLPKSIVYTRQGNYRFAAQEKDGITGIRAMDMFTDGWVDTSKNILNQADEQMRLLSHGIERMSRYRKPLPRFWYFPDTLKCLVTLNNDGEDSKEVEFQPQFADVDSKGVKMTLYVKETDLISEKWISDWREKGFEISGHPDDTRQAVNPDWKTMDSVYKALLGRLNSRYHIPSMHTVVNHWFVWCGKNAGGSLNFAAQADIEEQNGVELDCNYAHYDNFSNQGHFLGAMGTGQGNYTGSGLVMKFADGQGRMINLYQQLNNVYDQQYMENKDQDGYLHCFQGLMDRSMDQEVYSFICVKAHNAEYFFSKIPLMKMLDYAHDKKIPVWTEQRLLDYLKVKENAGFENIQWAKSVLTFDIHSSLKDSSHLTCMIPDNYNGEKIDEITVNGIRQPYIVRSIKGFEYAMLLIRPGLNYKLTAHYMN